MPRFAQRSPTRPSSLAAHVPIELGKDYRAVLTLGVSPPGAGQYADSRTEGRCALGAPVGELRLQSAAPCAGAAMSVD